MAATTEPPMVLIADDQPHVREALELLLKTVGMRCEAVAAPEAVVRALRAGTYDLLLMDLNYTRDTTSSLEGLELLSRVRAVDPLLPIVAMTGWATLDLAVEAMRNGLSDFVQKPWDNARLLTTIRREIDRGREGRSQSRQRRRELENAHHIQRGLLPQTVPQLGGWTIAAEWKPANDVGGDYFDLIPFGPTRLGICIADVVGKGVSAAILMSNLQGVVRAIAAAHEPPAGVCAKVNRVMCGKMNEGRFITLFYGVLDSAAGTLTWSNAGHNPMVVHHADGSQDVLTGGGMVIGVFPDARYGQTLTPVNDGDRVVLYTDGITEAENAAEHEFGHDRLAAVIAAHAGGDAATLQRAIFEAVSGFCDSRFRDDATVIVLAAASGAAAACAASTASSAAAGS